MGDDAVDHLAAEMESGRALTERAMEVRAIAGQDRLRAMALGILGGIPAIGGVLTNVIAVEIPAAREQRLGELLYRLAAHIEALDNAAKAAAETPPPDYPAILEAVLEDAIRTSEAEKREAYAAILVNALVQGGDEEERLLFVDLLRGCRPIHVRMVGVLSEDPGIEGARCRLEPWSTLHERLPEYSDELIRLAWANLYDWGLLNTPATYLGGTTPQVMNVFAADRRTPVGIRFVRFISRRS